MAKGFRLRISRLITSFQTCRSKDPSALPSDPVPSFLLHHHRSSFNRHVSSAFASTPCALRSNTKTSPARPRTEPPPQFKWHKDHRWHVVAKAHSNDLNDNTPRQKIYNPSASGNSSDDLFPPADKKKLQTKNKKKTAEGVRFRLSTTSSASLFSSDTEEELETLVSTSRSFSPFTDSAGSVRENIIPRFPPSRRRPAKTRKKKKKTRGEKSGGGESPARLSVFMKRMVPCGAAVKGKVKESYAVVKRSEDPKEDFKRSMVEMVVEKQMFEEEELEQLLQCFLSLNSRSHQGVIVEAFTEIWEALFSSSASAPRVSSAAGRQILKL